jgi:hypothetical protein
MKLRKIAALVGGAALTVSLIGAGVGATFTAASAANDTITVGKLAIQAYTSNDNASWGNACTVTVNVSTGSQVCYVYVVKNGTVAPSNLQIVATVSSGSIPEASDWSVSDGATPGVLNNATPPTWNYANPSFSWDAGYTVTWAGLSNASLGTSFVLTFTATASA